MISTGLPRRRRPAGLEPLSPKRKWQAITLATLLLVPAYWSILGSMVSESAMPSHDPMPDPQGSLALGLILVPYVSIVLAFVSEHPNAPAAVLKAMGLTLGVGILVSAFALDAVTGLVAGVGAGGIVALRMDDGHTWRARALAVLFAVLYVFVIVRLASSLALLPAPIFPFTAIGIADHLSERRRAVEPSRQ
jgi:hypothetical protein